MTCPIDHSQHECPVKHSIDPTKLSKIPQPPKGYLGLFGHLPDLETGFPVRSLWGFMDKHGPILEVDLHGSRILVGNHEIFKELFDEELWLKQPSKAQIQLRDVGGDGLVTAFSGERNWGKARRLLNPYFGPLGLRNMFDDMLEISSQLVLMWDRYGPENEIDCVEDFTRLTFDTIGLCAFNMRFNEFYTEEPHPFAKQLAETLVECGKRASRPNFVNNWLFYKAEQTRQDNITKIKALSDKIVQDRLTNPQPQATDLLNVLLHGVDKETGEKLPSENVRCQIATFLAAGYDTTASSLSFLYYYLCDNPEVLLKAQREVDDVVGDKVVTVSMLSRLTYLSACIKESLRLNSPVNILNRDATKDNVLGGKYLIKKGIRFRIWGDDADEFRPERMLNGGFEALPPGAWKPFGNGSRVCIGQGFAEQEILINLCQVLQRFEIRKADPNYKLVLKSTLTTKPDGFRMKVTRRPGRNIMFGIPGGASTEEAPTRPQQRERTFQQGVKNKPLTVLYGGNMGTCEGLAHDLAEKAPDLAFEVDVRDLNAAVDNLPTDRPCVIITSSYEGRPPENTKNFVAWIEKLARDSERLPKGVQYAVFGAGNSDWPSTFHRIPKLVDETLATLGAEPLINACHGNVKLGIMGPWEKWSEKLLASLSGINTSDLTMSSVGVAVSIGPAANRSRVSSGEEMSNATVVSNIELADTSVGAAKRHVEFALPLGTTYTAGDYLVLQGRNPEEMVRRVLTRFGLSKHDMMTIESSKKSFLTTSPIAVGQFLSSRVELATPITRKQLSTLQHYAPESSPERKNLESLQEEKAYETLLEQRYSIVDILEQIPALQVPFGAYLDMLLPLGPRQYSISSSPLEAGKRESDGHGPLASVTLDVFESPAMSGRGIFRGVVSSYLSACRPGDRIQCFVRPNTLGFRLPDHAEDPIILLAAGTGIAPMRAFIAERAAIKQAGTHVLWPAILFYGCRSPERDYLYHSELDKWEPGGVVEMVPCFSKPENMSRGRHVPDGLWEHRERVWDLLHKNGRIYVCGSAAKLGRSTWEMLKRISIEKTGETEADADKWLDDLKRKGAYWTTMPSATIPGRQTALVVQGPGKLAIQHDVPVPSLGPNTAIIRVAAVAINPVDAKILDLSPAVGAVHGYDFAGTILAVGVDVPTHLKIGDRVAGSVHGNNALERGTGAFSEFVAADADLLLKMPDDMSFEDGATIGIGLGTALLCIFRELELAGPLYPREAVPDSRAEFVLVAGGATATGTRTIQLLKLLGFRVLATSSPSSADLALRFGAEKVFDYHNGACAADIRSYTRNTLAYAIDCVSLAETTQLCYGAIGRAGGRYVSLEPYRAAITSTRPTIDPSFAMGLTLFGKKVALEGVYGREAQPLDRKMAREMFPQVQKLVDDGLFWTHPVKSMDGGWDGVMQGVDIIRKQTMSGCKLVYAVQ
ncbi:cytochrome P450 [Xylariaceae sp. FL0016]|nr:cytochrome P450 [Xylariaceae sp. FL0016]